MSGARTQEGDDAPEFIGIAVKVKRTDSFLA